MVAVLLTSLSSCDENADRNDIIECEGAVDFYVHTSYGLFGDSKYFQIHSGGLGYYEGSDEGYWSKDFEFPSKVTGKVTYQMLELIFDDKGGIKNVIAHDFATDFDIDPGTRSPKEIYMQTLSSKDGNLLVYNGVTEVVALFPNDCPESPIELDDDKLKDLEKDAEATVTVTSGDDPTDISETSVTIGGNKVTIEGSDNVPSEFGIKYISSDDYQAEKGSLATTNVVKSGTYDDFSVSISGLDAGQTYIYYAYAIVDDKEYKSPRARVFKTNDEASQIALPTVTTGELHSSSYSSITLSSNMVSGDGVSGSGLVYSISTFDPSDEGFDAGSLSSVANESGSHTSFQLAITGLTEVTYYVAAYATNSTGTAYGSVLAVNTKSLEFTGNSSNAAELSCGNESIRIDFMSKVDWTVSTSVTGGEGTSAVPTHTSGGWGDEENVGINISGTTFATITVTFKKAESDDEIGTFTITPNDPMSCGGGEGGGEIPDPEIP